MGIISKLNQFDWGIIPRFYFLIFKEFAYFVFLDFRLRRLD